MDEPQRDAAPGEGRQLDGTLLEGRLLEGRLTELETRLAFQEQALVELSDALAAARIESSRNAELLRRAMDELRQSRDVFQADPVDEPPPPHY